VTAGEEVSLSVRRAVAADAPAVAKLAAGLGYRVQADDVRRRLAALPESHVVFVASDEERVVGWLHGLHGHSVLHGDRVEIAGLVVSAGSQGRGVGTLLVTHLEQWALQRDVHTVRVLSGSERHGAHRFYHARGYRQLKTEVAFTKAL
jgi:GNAT superfamily N-acetyltransferase